MSQIGEVIEPVREAGGFDYAREPALRLARAGRRRARRAGAIRRPGCPPGQHYLRRGPEALMASGPHRPGFYLGVLVAGFLAGDF